MQTFLPYPDFVKSAKCLDYRRLGKQRLEAKIVLNILLNRTDKRGWKHHPIIAMWNGYENALKLYYNIILDEWVNRGYSNTMKYEKISDTGIVKYPKWLGDEGFHSSHRSNLLRKDFKYYSQFGWTDSIDQLYVWPISDGDLRR